MPLIEEQPAQHLAAGVVQAAPVQARLGLRPEAPVERGVAHRVEGSPPAHAPRERLSLPPASSSSTLRVASAERRLARHATCRACADESPRPSRRNPASAWPTSPSRFGRSSASGRAASSPRAARHGGLGAGQGQAPRRPRSPRSGRPIRSASWSEAGARGPTSCRWSVAAPMVRFGHVPGGDQQKGPPIAGIARLPRKRCGQHHHRKDHERVEDARQRRASVCAHSSSPSGRWRRWPASPPISAGADIGHTLRQDLGAGPVAARDQSGRRPMAERSDSTPARNAMISAEGQ